ncbi:putative methyltransferase [Mycobacterium xenopi 3993]|nr:putative methyltransferase [Mycobacterium xenopi 3993]
MARLASHDEEFEGRRAAVAAAACHRRADRGGRHDSKLAQVLYHDWEAENYDEKWSISYDQRCVDYARHCFDAVVPDEEIRVLPYDRALELGCGTGFFLLNLIQSGLRGAVRLPTCRRAWSRSPPATGGHWDSTSTVGSPTLRAFPTTTTHSTWWSDTRCCTTSRRSSCRCARPSACCAGRAVRVRRRADHRRRPLRAHVIHADLADHHQCHQAAGLGGWRRPQAELDESSRAAALEALVDLHTFTPGELERMATNAGAVDVRSTTEEFSAAMLGWPLRTIEAAVPPGAWVGAGRNSRSPVGRCSVGSTPTCGGAWCRRRGSTTSCSPG